MGNLDQPNRTPSRIRTGYESALVPLWLPIPRCWLPEFILCELVTETYKSNQLSQELLVYLCSYDLKIWFICRVSDLSFRYHVLTGFGAHPTPSRNRSHELTIRFHLIPMLYLDSGRFKNKGSCAFLRYDICRTLNAVAKRVIIKFCVCIKRKVLKFKMRQFDRQPRRIVIMLGPFRGKPPPPHIITTTLPQII